MKPLLFASIAGCILVVSAAAQSVPDHLKCYKVKDPQPKAAYTADLGGLVAEPGCVIKVPATMACVPATKANVMPAPPGGGATGTPNAFGCYKVKCPKADLPPLQLNDQFGSRSVTPSTPKLLCAPAPAPPTTVATPCGNVGYPTCNGSCPADQECVPVLAGNGSLPVILDGGSYCGCAPVPACKQGSPGNCPASPTNPSTCVSDAQFGIIGCGVATACCGNLGGGGEGPSCGNVSDDSTGQAACVAAFGTVSEFEVCNGATGLCGSTTGTGTCCQFGSTCFEGPSATITNECNFVGGVFHSSSRCLANGQCSP